jgi:hypothetical protein
MGMCVCVSVYASMVVTACACVRVRVNLYVCERVVPVDAMLTSELPNTWRKADVCVSVRVKRRRRVM